MRLKDKQTGEVGDYTIVNRVGKHCVGVAKDGDIDNPIFFDSIAELNERFEDAPEEKKYGGRVPKNGDTFYYISAAGAVIEGEWLDGGVCESRFECNNGFWTEKEAEKELARRKAYFILKEDTKGFVPDWYAIDEPKYFVGYRWGGEGLVVDHNWRAKWLAGPYFATEEDAEASIKAHSSEWKTWLGV